MKTGSIRWEKFNIAVVIPCYRVEHTIGGVLLSLPAFVQHIIVVDDASPDDTAVVVNEFARQDGRVQLLQHAQNIGVGGAMITGFKKALEMNADIIVKMDGDGQMAADYLPSLLLPLARQEADYAKGNRFQDLRALEKMPWLRRTGNLGLSFLSKAATGYWNVFDPTNGYVAIRAEALRRLPLDAIDRTYFFETSMLAYLYLLGAVVRDVPMPAQYGNEISNLSIRRTLLEFPPKLLTTLMRRIILKTLIYDFSMQSIYWLTGLPLLLFGLSFGSWKWAVYASQNIPAPTGTVMLATLSVLLGIQFLIAATEIDLHSVPDEPLCKHSY